MEQRVGGILIEVLRGDITQMGTDAIVNAANNHFWMGGGVAGAIKRAGGERIESEAMSQGPRPVGESIVTGGGRLPARYVVHAAVMGQDLRTSAEAIRDATGSALERAEGLELHSIALPAFGTGVGGFPPRESADAMMEAVMEFLGRGERRSLQRIVFVLFSEELNTAFEDALASSAAEAS